MHYRNRSRLLPALLALLALSMGGCSWMDEDPTANWSAKEFYDAGREALSTGDYTGALENFTKLEARYPYGRYAEQAQLETIYVHYLAEETDASVAAAERFIKTHPRHANVDYAYYMRGLATYDPGINFLERLFPQEKSERDPQLARESFRYFEELVTRYPRSRYAKDAIERMTVLRNNLARYEVHVADYYMRRGAPLAAVNRAKYVLEYYQRSDSIPDALVVMVRGYRQMGMEDLAGDALRVLITNHPTHAGVTELTAEGAAAAPQPTGE